MEMMKKNRHKLIILLFLACAGIFILPGQAFAAVMEDYCTIPSFVTQPAPPLVMLESGRDHKFYYEAFNDATDIDEDGRIDLTYKHTIDYYGYFDHHKCYTYAGGGSPQFNPVSVTASKFCSSTQWSGNVLNWMTMSRMDVLKKVLYGGERLSESPDTVLQRVYIPQDAHSWGKEVTGRLCSNGTGTYTYNCKRDSDCDSGYTCVDTAASGKYLIPFAASTPPNDCSFTSAIANTTGKVTVARYRHSGTSCGTDHADLMASYEPTAANFIDTFQITNFSDTRLDPAPPSTHYDYYNIFATAEFNVPTADKNKTWQFFVDSDDGAEVQIDGTVVAAYYGCHSSCPTSPTTACDINQMGGIVPGSSGYHKIIVRHSETTGQDGVKVWYRIGTTGPWLIFPTGLTVRTPNIVASALCTIQADGFINNGVPVTGTPGGQHLFCSTTLSDGGTPILRMIPNNTHRIWEWASKERPVCSGTYSDGSLTGTITDYDVKVKVCDSSIGLESNCKTYGGSYHKPAGLLQKYGENSTGDKVCSKSMTKSCNSNSDCSFASNEGQCMYKADMYFGFMSTSYTNNLSGGVLRKNINSILDETNFNNGYFQSSANVPDAIIRTFDRFKPVGFQYSDHSYQGATGGACGWITNRGLNQGECRMWGNPIGEMMYEGLRYFAGKNTHTADFKYTGPADSGLNLSLATWGYKDGSTQYPPYTLFPNCARPFALVLSDVNTSYDNDQLPGAYGSSFVEDANLPMLNMNVSTLADVIGTTEGINSNNWFIGESGSTNNFLCTSKSISNLSAAKGLCPEEPTKKGTYYSAAVAYYGKKMMKANTGKPNVDTFVIALASPLADLKFKAGNNIVTVLPVGKSVSGCSIGSIYDVYTPCASKCTLTTDANGSLNISNCTSNAYCPSNQIVDLYVDSIKYDSNKNVVYAKYRINFEDVEQGADHDMDAIVKYEVCTQDAVDNGYGSCGTALGSNIQVKVDSSQYASGCIDQVMGFVISGTTEDGVYLVVKDNDVPNTANASTPTIVTTMPKAYSKTFTTTGTATDLLKNPLWYAAKWGGFDDYDGNDKPYTSSTCGTATPNSLCKEWDKDGDGDPDNYFLVVNPQKLEDQMDAALGAMLSRAASGTAASVLASGEGSGANLIQAVYYPRKKFGNDEIGWIGRLTNLWYYVDPNLNNSNIREDAGVDNLDSTFGPGDRMLTLKTGGTGTHNDNIVQLFFDPIAEVTKARRWNDTNGDSVIDAPLPDLNFESSGNLWEAGGLLWKRNLSTSPRTIYTTTTGAGLTGFSTANKTALRPYLQAASDAESEAIIRYVHGEDTPFSPIISGITPTYRSRSVNYDGSGNKTWKLGDILNSTPKISSWLPLNMYHTLFKDTTYGVPGKTPSLQDAADPTHFITSSAYRGRGMIFAGSNDGMLHAFKLGSLDLKWAGQGAYDKARLTGTGLGEEQWAFIPKNALPYLKYLTDPAYCHVYTVDLTPFVFDASIGGASDAVRTVNDWRTILIGGMRYGGGCRKPGTCASASDCVNTPALDPLDSTKGLGYSSYFALDITNEAAPVLLWEFSHEDLGYSTAGPALLRMSVKDIGGNPLPDRNGKWFVVLASGPTGPIDLSAKQFLAKSDQNLKLFVLDLKTGPASMSIINTLVPTAFAGSMLATNLDTDLDYQDDVLYIPYVKRAGTSPNYTWTDGGVLRLSTKEDVDPANWVVSTLVDGIGPVTSSVAKLQNKNANALWTFFGTGRYFFSVDGVADDPSSGRKIFGVKDPCLSNTSGLFLPNCTASAGALTNVTDVANVELSPDSNTAYNGWFINLDADYKNGNVTIVNDPTVRAERVITDPLAATSGVVFFTTFKPYSDQCSLGGTSAIWATKYNTGGDASALLKGQALIQVSTGSIEQLKLSDAFKDTNTGLNTGNRKSAAMKGVPPSAQGLSVISAPPPTKKVLHIKER